MARIHDSGIIMKLSNLGFKQQLKLEDVHHQLGALSAEGIEKSPRKKEKAVSLGLERLKKSPYLVKFQMSPRQRPKLITYKKEVVTRRLPRAYKYFQTEEFHRPSVEATQDYCPVEIHDKDTSSDDDEYEI